MSRVLLLAALCAALSGCSFASYARRSNGYPGAYDRALARADQAKAPALRAEIEAMGARYDYNSATHDVLWCLDHYADGLRWKRQLEKGDVFSEAELGARLEHDRGKVAAWDYDEYGFALKHLASPEVPWKRAMQECARVCGKVASGEAFEPPAPRDIQLAKKYAALCEEELAHAKVLTDERDTREKLAAIAHDLDVAEESAGQGRYYDLAVFLEQAERRAAAIKPPERAQPLVARANALRERHAEPLKRVAAYRADPRLAQLERRAKSLETSYDLVQQQIDEAAQVIEATAARTHYDAQGLQVGYESGDPQTREAFIERKRLLLEKQKQIEQDQRDVREAITALQAEYHLR
ncbi:MAG: hypothetical protein IRZ16_19285 [Myxococcaceae bacterium]|nr:hypothetical protein [Myxococcaceae bacterium]